MPGGLGFWRGDRLEVNRFFRGDDPGLQNDGFLSEIGPGDFGKKAQQQKVDQQRNQQGNQQGFPDAIHRINTVFPAKSGFP